MTRNLDFDVFDHGAFLTLDPNTNEAADWVLTNLRSSIPWGSGFIVEPEDSSALLESLESNGYSFEVHDKKGLYTN